MTKWRDDERGGVVAWYVLRICDFAYLYYGGRFISGGRG